ncbi:MAG TPA: hypothetical protein VFT56_16315 [Sphingomonas sp.]|nr:hypothetical protein [Sphingomonas sp.]
MPIYTPDPGLQLSAAQYVRQEHAGVTKRAATALNLDYIMLRRFLVGGRAKPENRQKIRDALDALGWGVAKDHIVAHEMPIDVTRSMLTQLLEALDAYQSASSSVLRGTER